MKKRAKAWTKKQDIILLSLREENISFKKIADIIDRSETCCKTRYRKLNKSAHNMILESSPELIASVRYLRSRGHFVHEEDGQIIFNYRFRMNPDELIQKALRVKQNTRLAA